MRFLAAVLLLAATGLFSLLLAQQPAAGDDFQRHMQAGQRYYNQGKHDEAIREFREALKLRPNDSVGHMWLGRALGRKTEKANPLRQPFMVGGVRDEFEKAVQLDPHNLEARSDLLDFYAEAPGVFGGGIDKAKRQAEAIAKLDPAEGHSAWARIAVKEKHYDVAEREYRAAVAAKPDSPGYRRDLQEFLRKHGPEARKQAGR
jgi:tetratricopeptide (TPR) repeat protein